MGAFLEKPVTTKSTEKGEGPDGIKYGVSAMQGWRKDMEDTHICNTNFFLKEHAFFGVFDGHAGVQASEYCAENMLEHIVSGLEETEQPSLPETIQTVLKNGFVSFDSKMLDALGYSSSKMRGGTTAVTAMITPDKIIWSNCGDSRGILCRSGKLHFNTEDHKPFLDHERKRIESAGGTVMMQRVNGSLAVSRALGDFEFKTTEDHRDKVVDNPVVCAVPDVTITDRDQANDEFIVLACDGVFDVMSNEEIVQFVSKKLTLMSDLPEICNSLIDLCLNKNSRDNMSVILITFSGAPKVTDKAIEEEKELLTKVTEFMSDYIQSAVNEIIDPLDIDEMEILSQLTQKASEIEALQNFDFYLERPQVAEIMAQKKKIKFGDPGSMDGPSDSSEAPSAFHRFQHPADDIFQPPAAAAPMQTETGSEDNLSSPLQTDSSTNSV